MKQELQEVVTELVKELDEMCQECCDGGYDEDCKECPLYIDILDFKNTISEE